MYYLGNRYLSLNILIVVLSEFFMVLIFALVLSALELGEEGRVGVTPPSMEKSLVVTFFYISFLYLFDLFSSENYRPNRRMIIRLLQSVISAAVSLTIFYAFFTGFNPGIKHNIAYTALIPFLLIAWRAIYIEVLSVNFPQKKVLVLGYGKQGQMVASEILGWYGHGFGVVGFIEDNPKRFSKEAAENRRSVPKKTASERRHPIRRSEDIRLLGGYGDIEKIVSSERIYMVIVALPDRRSNLPMSALLKCKLQGVRIVEGDTFLERITGKVAIDQIRPGWLIFSEGFKSIKTKMRIKRVFDIVLSLLGLLFSAPIALLAVLLIKLESRGPVIFKQVRVGEGGKEYDIFKFRSMRVDAEAGSGPVWAKESDSRITAIGRFLRKTRIDEIPQLFNTLKGDMSFVGPRPERPFFVAELKQVIPYYEVRTVIKPGITGWAQIRYSYGADLKDAIEKLQYDIFYIKNMSILFDLIIIFKTVKVILAVRGSR